MVVAVVGKEGRESRVAAASQLLSDLGPGLLSHWGPGFSENQLLAVNKANVASYLAVSYPQSHSFRCE